MYTHEYSNDFVRAMAISNVVVTDAGKGDIRLCCHISCAARHINGHYRNISVKY